MTALQIWRSLADQGYAAAQHNLGFMYYSDLGEPQRFELDQLVSFSWF